LYFKIVGQHQIIYDVYFSQADSTGSGTIGAFDANNFLKLSKLKEDQLKAIWDMADPTGKGYLDRHGFYVCLKLIALAQSNQSIQMENLNLPSSAPKLGELSSNITLLVSSDDPWYIKASARINYDKIFDSLSPINNKLSGARVKPFLINSALPVDILGKVRFLIIYI
jgi:epidermal growth factor receptor substrate 15